MRSVLFGSFLTVVGLGAKRSRDLAQRSRWATNWHKKSQSVLRPLLKGKHRLLAGGVQAAGLVPEVRKEEIV